MTVVNDEQDLQELEHFSIWKLVQYFVREQTNETTVSISLFSNKTCFRVDPSDSSTFYTVQPSQRELKRTCINVVERQKSTWIGKLIPIGPADYIA